LFFYGKILLLVFTGLLISRPVTATQDLQTGRKLFVKESGGDQMPGVSVRFRCLDGCEGYSLESREQVLLTDTEGSTVIPYQGNVEILVRYLGYESVLDTVEADVQQYHVKLDELEFFAQEMVVTAQQSQVQSIDAIQKINIISEERIKQQAAFSLRELLIADAGIQLSQDGITGSGVSINGISGENVKILMDGVPLVGRLDGQIDISQINLANVERIEIVEGPMSAIYGSNALGGVINIITKKQAGENLTYHFNTRHETIDGELLQPHEGIYNFDGGLGYGFGDFLMKLSGSRNYFGGMKSESGGRRQIWSPKEQYSTDVSLGYNINNDTELSFLTNYFNETLINKGDLIQPFGETAFDDYFYTDRITTSLNLESSDFLGAQLNTVLSYSYFNRIRNNYIMNLVTLESDLSADPSRHDTTTFDNIMLRSFYTVPDLGETTEVQLGIELNHDRVVGERIEGATGQTIEDYAGFISVTQELGDFKLLPTIRFIQNSRYDAPVIPSLSLRYGGVDDLVVRASVATGFRAPSVKELYLFFVDVNHNIRGNPDLSAENSISANLNLDYQMPFGKNDFPWLLKFSYKIFYNRIRDRISLAQDINDPSLYSYFNLANFISAGNGMDLSLLTDDFNLSIGLVSIGRSSVLSDNEINFTPEIDLNTSYRFSDLGLSLAVNAKYTGQRPIFLESGEDIIQGFIPAFTNVDVSSNYEITESFGFNIGVRNLLNITTLQTGVGGGGVHSSGSGGAPIAWGRTFFFGFSIN